MVEILGFNAINCLSSYIQILSVRSNLLGRIWEDQRVLLKAELGNSKWKIVLVNLKCMDSVLS